MMLPSQKNIPCDGHHEIRLELRKAVLVPCATPASMVNDIRAVRVAVDQRLEKQKLDFVDRHFHGNTSGAKLSLQLHRPKPRSQVRSKPKTCG